MIIITEDIELESSDYTSGQVDGTGAYFKEHPESGIGNLKGNADAYGQFFGSLESIEWF